MKNNLAISLRRNSSLLALLLAAFVIYLPTLSAGFVVDDTPLIKDNPYIHGNHLAEYFSQEFWANTALGDHAAAMYRPLVLVLLSLSDAIWGNNPAGYHALLLLLHLANTALVYILVRKLTAVSPVDATFGAAIFALHPTRVESVAWISGITDPLAIFFLLGAMLAHRAYIESTKGWRYLALSLFCFQMALWSKEVAIVFPLILVAHDYIFRKKISWPAVFMHTLLVAAYLVTRSLVLDTTEQWNSLGLSGFARVVDFVLGYSEMLVFPSTIPFYIQPPQHPVSSALGWISAIAIVALAGFSWRAFDPDRKKALTFSAIWVVAFSWPAALIMLYMDGYYAARFMYVPAVGVAIFASILCGHVIAAYPSIKAVAMAPFALIIAFYGAITLKELPSWHDDGAIYGKITRVAPESADGYFGLGHYQMKQEDYAAAEKSFLVALQKSGTPKHRASALAALGTIYGMANKLQESERYLIEAVQIEPGNSEALTGLGNLALMQGQISLAISYYEKALAARPGNYEAAMNLAVAYEKINQPERTELIRRTAR